MVFFDCGGVRLHLQKAHEPDAIAKASVLYLRCEDIVGTAAELKRRGAGFSISRTGSPSSVATISG